MVAQTLTIFLQSATGAGTGWAKDEGRDSISAGHQQVNNGSCTPENEIVQNRVLGANNGKRLDAGTTGTASRTDPEMATLGEVDGTRD